MPRLPREAGIVGVGDRLDAQKEVVDVDAMKRTLILFGVLRAHEEFAGWNQREFWCEVRCHGCDKRIHFRAMRLETFALERFQSIWENRGLGATVRLWRPRESRPKWTVDLDELK